MTAAVRDLTGQVVVVTGSTSGIGLAAAVALAARGAGVVLVGRNRQRLDAAVDRVAGAGGPRPLAYQADFARLDEVHVLADSLRQRVGRISVLASNAGLIALRRHITVDGHELTVQVNHLAGFLLANLLRERLRRGRLVITASDAHRGGSVDPGALSAPGGYAAYRASKAANVLFALEATRRWPDIRSVSFHPGVVRTRLGAGTVLAPFFRAPLLRTPEKAADIMTWLVTAPAGQLQPGGYYVNRTPRPPAAHAADPHLAARLWEASLAAVGLSWT